MVARFSVPLLLPLTWNRFLICLTDKTAGQPKEDKDWTVTVCFVFPKMTSTLTAAEKNNVHLLQY